MLLTLATTHRPATDLGYLLMKHPDNVHVVELPFDRATVLYPQADEARCEAALIVEVDPVALVRGRGGAEGREDQYVNDRPYAASSLLAAAIGKAFGTAMTGRSKLRQELADMAIPLKVVVEALPVRGGRQLAERLFEPLGYQVQAEPIALDPARPEWGDSPYVRLTLSGDVQLARLLAHLSVLIPVLNDSKVHHYLGDDDVAKLLRRGEGWLDAHPERELITRRYLRFGSLIEQATAAFEEAVVEPADELEAGEAAIERPLRLNDERLDRVAAMLKASGATSVVDLGCGEGRLLRRLLDERQFTRIVGVDVAPAVLARAGDRLRLERLPDMQRKRIALLQGSLVYRDDRLKGFDAAALVEVIEHLEPERLPAFEAVVFGHARPGTVIVTTPNAEHNALFASLALGAFRHADHRFEWSRADFTRWAEGVAARHSYTVAFEGIGPAHEAYGAPTQMGVFTRC